MGQWDYFLKKIQKVWLFKDPVTDLRVLAETSGGGRRGKEKF